MTSINVKLLVNRFDSDPSIRGAELEVSDTISIIKERYFAEDIEKQFNIRIIHGGCTLRDDLVLSGLRGYKVGEQLVLTVFVTKPDTLPTVPEPATKSNLWTFTTSLWILVLATLWYYKLKLGASFRRFPLFVMYAITFVCLHVLFTRMARSGRAESR